MMQQNKLISSFDYLEPVISGSKNREWYYEDDNKKDKLLISVGDSWTWGDSLGKIADGLVDDKDYRVRNIYGYHLSNMLNTDFINIGIPGGANLKILDHLRIVLKNLTKNYKKIYIIFTLTESARDLNSLDLIEDSYNQVKDSTWPPFKHLTNADQSTIDFILNDINSIGAFHLSDIIRLYLNSVQCLDVDSLFKSLDNTTINLLESIRAPNIKLLIGRNFTSWASSCSLSHIKYRWTDVISKYGEINRYPEDLFCLTHSMGFNIIDRAVKYHLPNINVKNFKEDMLLHMKKAESAITWLNQSPYNSNIATKHPLEDAHRWWASEIYNNFNDKN